MSNLVSKINGLEKNESIDVIHNGADYKIDCYMVYSKTRNSIFSSRKSFAISKVSEYGSISSMNIQKITNNFITLYSFDIFGNKNTARIKIADITIEE